MPIAATKPGSRSCFLSKKIRFRIESKKFSSAFPPPYEKTARVAKYKAAGQRLQYLQSRAASSTISCLDHMSVHLKETNFISGMFKPVGRLLVREQGKKCGALLFSLNFLWLLSLFQDKESNIHRDRFNLPFKIS
jgi:hypothetical protein